MVSAFPAPENLRGEGRAPSPVEARVAASGCSALVIAPDNLPCHQPARTAPVDGANLDLRSAPLRRSTYPLPSYLLFALTSEPTGQQDATSSATPRLHTDLMFDSHPTIH